MEEKNIQLQIDALNQKLDLILEEISIQKQSRESIEDLASDLSIIGKDVFKHTVLQLDKAGVEFDGEALNCILIKLLRNLNNINELLDTLESVNDLIKDVTPIVHQVGLDAIHKMAELESKGYIDFIKAFAKVGDEVVKNFSIEEIQQLSQNISPALKILKRLSQPDIIKGINKSIEVYDNLNMTQFEHYSIFSALKELRSPEIKRSLGFIIHLVKGVASK